MTNNLSTAKIIIGLLVIGIIGFFIGSQLADSENTNIPATTDSGETRDTLTEDSTDMDMVDDAEEDTMDTANEMDAATDPVVTSAGVYTDYDQALLANADSGEVLLFFHASWCPSCRSLEKDINSKLENIPSDVTILKLNYDTENELKKKYGVVRQHTLVRVDANGNKIETLTGLTNTLDQVLTQI